MTTTGSQPFKRPVSDQLDKWIFLTAFFVGSASIVVFRHLDVWRFDILVAPTVILCLYTLYVVRTVPYKTRLDRLGDNIYYLGLLYTLVSLSVSLYLLIELDDQVAVVSELMTKFGLALWSTILGMFFRVFVQQFQANDPVDVEEKAHASLTEAVRSLRTELFTVTADVNSYRRATAQSVEELAKELSESIRLVVQEASQALRDALTEMTKTTTGLTGTVESTVSSLVGRLENIEIDTTVVDERLTAVGDSLGRISEKIDEACTGVVSKLGSIEIDGATVTSNLVEVGDALGRAAKEIDARGEAERRTAAELASLQSTLERLGAVELDVELSAVAVRMQATREALDVLNTVMRESCETQRESARELSSLMETMREQAEMSVKSTLAIQDRILGSVAALRKLVRGREA